MVGNLFTTAGQKSVVTYVAGRIHNFGKHTHILFFPLRAWRAAQELLVSRRLPTPALGYRTTCAQFRVLSNIQNYGIWTTSKIELMIISIFVIIFDRYESQLTGGLQICKQKIWIHCVLQHCCWEYVYKYYQ